MFLGLPEPPIDKRNSTPFLMTLYKYYPIRDYNLTAFKKAELFFAKPRLLNDCCDTSDILYSNYKDFCSAMGWTSERSIPKIGDHAVCCFSKATSADSLRMWNLYGDAMNGFAIEYNMSALNHVDLMNIHPIRVVYRRHPLDLNNMSSSFRIDGERFTIADCIKGRGGKELDRLFEYLHVCKDYKQWSCEQEWRMIIGELKIAKGLRESKKKDGYLLQLPIMPYLSITIGSRASREDAEELKRIADEYKIPIKHARPAIVGRNLGVEIF